MAKDGVTTSFSFNGRSVKNLSRRWSLGTLKQDGDPHARLSRSSTRLTKPRPCQTSKHEKGLSQRATPSAELTAKLAPQYSSPLVDSPCYDSVHADAMPADRLKHVVKKTSLLFDRDKSHDTQEIDITAAIAVLHELKKSATPEELAVLQRALFTAEPVTETDSPYHRRGTSATPGTATRKSSPVLHKKPLKDNVESTLKERPRSINVPVAFAKGADKVAHKYSASLGVNPTFSRSFTPADLDVDSIGSYKLGTLRVTNGTASPEPSILDLEGSKLNQFESMTAREMAEIYAAECQSANSPYQHSTGPVTRLSTIPDDPDEGPFVALSKLNGDPPPTQSAAGWAQWNARVPGRPRLPGQCDRGYGSEGRLVLQALTDYEPFGTATKHVEQQLQLQTPARYNCVESHDTVWTPRRDFYKSDPAAEKSCKKLYKAPPSSHQATYTQKRCADGPITPNILSINFSRRNRPESYQHENACALDSHPVQIMAVPKSADIPAAGQKGVGKRTSFFHLKGRSRSKSLGRPEVRLPREVETVALAPPDNHVMHQRSTSMDLHLDSGLNRKNNMSESEARTLGGKQSRNSMTGGHQTEKENHSQIRRQRSRSVSPRADSPLGYEAPPVPSLPDGAIAYLPHLASDMPLSPLGSHPRQPRPRARTTTEAPRIPAVVVSRHVTPKSLNLSEPGSPSQSTDPADSMYQRQYPSRGSSPLRPPSRAYQAYTPRSFAHESTYRNAMRNIQIASPDGLFDRFGGGLEYGWERGKGFQGSAGTRQGGFDQEHKSIGLRESCGVDLSDVPVFIQKLRDTS